MHETMIDDVVKYLETLPKGQIVNIGHLIEVLNAFSNEFSALHDKIGEAQKDTK